MCAPSKYFLFQSLLRIQYPQSMHSKVQDLMYLGGKAWHLSQALCCLDQIALKGPRKFHSRNALEAAEGKDLREISYGESYNIWEFVWLYIKLCLAYAAVAELHCG